MSAPKNTQKGVIGDLDLARRRWSRTCVVTVENLSLVTDWLVRFGINLSDLIETDATVQICDDWPGRATLIFRMPDSCSWLPTLEIDGVGLKFRCVGFGWDSTLGNVLPSSVGPETPWSSNCVGAGDLPVLPGLPLGLANVWTGFLELITEVDWTVLGALSSPEAPEIVRTGFFPAPLFERNRGYVLAALAEHLRRNGATQDSIEEVLLQHNAMACEPALPTNEVQFIAQFDTFSHLWIGANKQHSGVPRDGWSDVGAEEYKPLPLRCPADLETFRRMQQRTGSPETATVIFHVSAVQRLTGLSISEIHRRMIEGSFPHPITLRAPAVGWEEADIQAWLTGDFAGGGGATPGTGEF